MKKILKPFLKVVNVSFRFAAFFCFFSTAHAIEKRIVTLAPSLAEMVYEIEESDHSLVGVSEFTNEPASLSSKPSIGPFFKVQIEKIVSLNPTHIIGTRDGNDRTQIEHLESMGKNVLTLSSSSLKEIEESYTVLGEFLGNKPKGLLLSKRFHQKCSSEKTKKQTAHSKIRVAYVLGVEPLVVVGGRGFLSEALDRLTAQNVFSDLKKPYPKVAKEELITRRPDTLVFINMSESVSSEKVKEVMKEWGRMGIKKSVSFSSDRIVRPTIALFDGVEKLAEKLDESK